jgi:glycerol-3-phosphate dehydrogenase
MSDTPDTLLTLPACVDLLIVGGGINGAAIARDAAGRGLSVMLVEADDLASHTSSASTKLIHGGLRYLEHAEFSLVRKALAEREILLNSAPHLVRPMRFVVPHDEGLRPARLVRLGLWLYDHLARHSALPRTRRLDLRRDPIGSQLRGGLQLAFEYSDGWADDARLTLHNALDAREHGATILTRTRCLSARRRSDGRWSIELMGTTREAPRLSVQARALVNATGPWAARFLQEALGSEPEARHAPALRLVRGSHLILNRVPTDRRALLLQTPAGRVIFVIPYLERYTLVGTTEVEVTAEQLGESASAEEIEELRRETARWLRRSIAVEEILSTYSGVRPLIQGPGGASALSRDYRLELGTGPSGTAPLMTIWGGKLTTGRKLAEEAVNQLCRALDRHEPAWTSAGFLPGGDLVHPSGGEVPDLQRDFARFIDRKRHRWPWLPEPMLQRMAHAYGTRMRLVLGDARGLADLGAEILPGLHEAELDYLIREEWARNAEDVLRRRTTLGLQLGPKAGPTLQAWMDQRLTAGRSSS